MTTSEYTTKNTGRLTKTGSGFIPDNARGSDSVIIDPNPQSPASDKAGVTGKIWINDQHYQKVIVALMETGRIMVFLRYEKSNKSYSAL